jgi:fido (protein-threonine AMPylation protein)
MSDDLIKIIHHSNLVEGVNFESADEDYLQAYEYALSRNGKYHTSDILKIHKLLMHRMDPRIAGKWRDCDVFIGGVRKIFISVPYIEDSVKEWIKSSNVQKAKDYAPEKKKEFARKWHVAYESLHPFADGNGRTGRILLNAQRTALGLEPLLVYVGMPPPMIREPHDEIQQYDYYSWFRNNASRNKDH